MKSEEKMAVTQKHIDISDTEMTAQQWAESQNNIWMNLLNGIRWDPIDNKYKVAPIKYSDVSLEGEKIRFGNNQEFQVLFSCLACEYAHKQEVKNKWNEALENLKKAYEEQKQLDRYTQSNNVDLKKLRDEGELLTKDELNK